MSIKQTTKNLAGLLIGILVYFSFQQTFAAGVCESDKSDISRDTQIINEKLKVRYGFSPIVEPSKKMDASYRADNIESIYDEQELKVDRSAPFLIQVNSVGVVTSGSAEAPISYGTAILVSPCHVLINAHAIVDQKTKDGQSPILVSLGQNSCDSKDAFSHQDIKGRVIAGGNADDQSSDYAIVRIPKVSDAQPALISTEYILKSNYLMTVGFPYKATLSKRIGFRYPTANFTKASGVGADGTFSVSNTSDSAGGSGSGVFILDDSNGRPQVVLAGIHRGQVGVGLQTAAILEHLKTNNLNAYKELAFAIQHKSCN